MRTSHYLRVFFQSVLTVILLSSVVSYRPWTYYNTMSLGLRAVRAAGVATVGGMAGVAGVAAVSGMVRDRLSGRGARRQERMRITRKQICYDMVGCFSAPLLKHSSLKKLPQSPESLDTKFWLMRRRNSTSNDSVVVTSSGDEVTPAAAAARHMQRLRYDDGLRSLRASAFDPSLVTRVLVHGFKGSAMEEGALAGADAFLRMEDINMVLVDWEKGAGASYSTAAANTELIGRQVGLLLMDMISVGADPDKIHIIGFSLGAHVAGCAGQLLKSRGRMIGRITGLDPASPLFRRQLVREANQKLDASDARLVDVLHTDGGALWTDGFGLPTPLGHVDFFPNGGRQQPGCADPRASVVVSHFEGVVNSSTVCSHARAWSLFLETIVPAEPGTCQFQAWPCPNGVASFFQGRCFPTLPTCYPNADGALDPSCGVMGVRAAETPSRGPLYLVTRETAPYCGQQLQATVVISPQSEPTRGVLQMQIFHGASNTSFQMSVELLDGIVSGANSVHSLAAAKWGSIGPTVSPNIRAVLSYQSLTFQTELESSSPIPDRSSSEPTIFIDRVSLRDIHGNSWHFCEVQTPLVNQRGTMFDSASVELSLKAC